MDEWLTALATMDGDARRASLAYVAGRGVDIPAEELNEALRRAVVVRAVGGNPQRELTLDEEAVVRLAAELDRVERRAALRLGLESLRLRVAEDASATEGLEALVADGELAWRCFAAARLAVELE